jgi:dihydrofolate synthase/folylpolyglutamate synthase
MGHLASEAESVIEGIAAERSAPLFHSDRLPVAKESPTECSFSLAPYFDIAIDAPLGMPGLHQAQNARTAALCAALALASEERLDATPICRGISGVKLPGRFEIRRIDQRECIFDAAHTASSVEAFTGTFRHLYPSGGVMILGVVAEKDLAGIAAALPTGLSRIFITRPGSFKSSDPKALHKEVERYYPNAELIEDPVQAWKRASETAAENEPILILGSFYLPAAVTAWNAERDGL